MKSKLIHLWQEKINGACEKLSNAILRTMQKPRAEAYQQEQKEPHAFLWKAATERHMFSCPSAVCEPWPLQRDHCCKSGSTRHTDSWGEQKEEKEAATATLEEQ